MGQSFSSHVGSEGSSRRIPRLSSLTAQREQNRPDITQDREEGEQSLLASNSVGTAGDGIPINSDITISQRHISSHHEAWPRGSNISDEGTSRTVEAALDHEERPLVGIEDLRIPDAPITDIRASPMPRRQSMWRFGSRHSRFFASTESTRSQGGSGNIFIEQSRSNEVPAPQVTSEGSRRRRESILSSIQNIFGPPQQPARRRLAPISRPIPISEDLAQYDLIGTARQAPTPEPSQNAHNVTSSPRLYRESSRLSRVRRSISGPMENIFGSIQRSRGRDNQEQGNNRSPRAESTAETGPDETEYLLPPIDLADQPFSLEDADNNRNPQNRAPSTPPTLPGALDTNEERRRSWAQRLADMTPSPRREGRGLNLLRGRSSRLIRRDDEAPLSRILQLAAAAIAAQLSGSPDALANLESVGDDNFDGGLNNFVEELNSVAGSSRNIGPDSGLGPGPATPLNFWRVFRFVSPSDDHSARAPESDNTDPRTVTLVVVGVRSVPSTSMPRNDTSEPNLDSLLGSPPGRSSHGSLLRSSLNRARLSRRSSLASSNPFPQQFDSQRHQRIRSLSSFGGANSGTASPSFSTQSSTSSPRHSRTLSDPLASNSLNVSYEDGFSRSISGDLSTQSSSSAGQTNALVRERSERSRSPSRLLESPTDGVVRQRRRSASESARHRNLGSGASRRNGTIDPDGGPVQGRSWLIYVVGTNLPEDHPAFTTPSLFTDNPSYEDMLLLSNILGPVKPPVASSDDVAASGGRYELVLREASGSLLARPMGEESEITVLASETCQVCLEAYAPGQFIRKLSKCSHIFHQECVDEWLTTGRNSCPLCRGLGVKEVSRDVQTS